MNIIETIELSHNKGSKYLLEDINWTVKEKEHWVVFGINGCGKTTLLVLSVVIELIIKA